MTSGVRSKRVHSASKTASQRAAVNTTALRTTDRGFVRIAELYQVIAAARSSSRRFQQRPNLRDQFITDRNASTRFGLMRNSRSMQQVRKMFASRGDIPQSTSIPPASFTCWRRLTIRPRAALPR